MNQFKPLKIVILAYPGMNQLDLSGPMQAFATASRLQPGYTLEVVSAQGGALLTSAGLTLMSKSLSELGSDVIDTLVVPGGSISEVYAHDFQLVQWIRTHAAGIRRICSVCTGAFLLAEAGLLDGRRATTHWESAAQLQQRYPAVMVDPDPIFIRADPVWTSAGVSAGIDLALALIEQDYGHQLAIAVARQMVVFIKRPGSQSQFSVPLLAQSMAASQRGRFSELHAWIADNLGQDLRVEILARQVSMSPRSFARSYVAEQGRTPGKAVEAMRLEAACRALEETDWPLKRIATDTGHGEEQNLRRVFQRQFGVSPVQYRSRFSAHAALPRAG